MTCKGLVMRKLLFRFVLSLGVLFVFAGSALAWPTQAVTIIVPFPPGGTTDVLARLVGQKMSEAWRVPVLIDNRAGAAGNLGTAAFVKSATDGHTLLLHTSSIAVAPAVYRQLNFDIAKDLQPITSVGSVPFLLVVAPTLAARSVPELVQELRRNPNKLNYASNGAGTIVHLAFEQFLKDAGGLQVTHIPYRGSAPAINDLIGGSTQMMIESVVTLLPHVQAGRLRAIAVTGRTPIAQLPNIPTVADSGVPGYEASSWYGLFGPKNMPAAVVEQIQRDVSRVLSQPAVRERMDSLGAGGGGEPVADFAKTVNQDISKWNLVARRINLTLE